MKSKVVAWRLAVVAALLAGGLRAAAGTRVAFAATDIFAAGARAPLSAAHVSADGGRAALVAAHFPPGDAVMAAGAAPPAGRSTGRFRARTAGGGWRVGFDSRASSMAPSSASAPPSPAGSCSPSTSPGAAAPAGACGPSSGPPPPFGGAVSGHSSAASSPSPAPLFATPAPVPPGAADSQPKGGTPRAGAKARTAARSAAPAGSRGDRAASGPALPALPAGEIRQAQDRLLALGYWVEHPTSHWDASWRQPLIAFQKANWRKRTGTLTRAEVDEILRAEPFTPRETGPAHIEVDLARQVFYMVDAAGAVSHVLTVSSGSGRPFRAPSGWRSNADTPCGHLAVFQRSSGWHKSELGEMYNPLYIVGGIAIHGSLDVPPKPVSHGCIRIPMYAAHHLPALVPKDTPVLVYGCPDEPAAAVPVAAVRK